MIWQLSHRFHRPAVAIADRHYSRQKPGTAQFMPTGSAFVLFAETDSGRAVWGTSWPRYVQHRWPGAWICSIFRNEGAGRASRLIRQAVAATRAHHGEPPAIGMVTFVDQSQIRDKKHPGHSFIIAGFRPDGETQGGLLALRIRPESMPAPMPALLTQHPLFEVKS